MQVVLIFQASYVTKTSLSDILPVSGVQLVLCKLGRGF